MRILLWHGYLLGGTGSNVYTRALAREWSRAGHDVTVVCQERHPERYDLGGARVVVPELPGPAAARLRPRPLRGARGAAARGLHAGGARRVRRGERGGAARARAGGSRLREPRPARRARRRRERDALSASRRTARSSSTRCAGGPISRAWGAETLAGAEVVYAGSEHIRARARGGRRPRRPRRDRAAGRRRRRVPARAARGGARRAARGGAGRPAESGNARSASPTRATPRASSASSRATQPTVVYFGKLIENKGVQVLLEALAGLDARAVVVGFGDYREELEALAPPGTLFTGPLEHRHLRHLLPLCDVAVVPSIFPEAFGMVAAEAAPPACCPSSPRTRASPRSRRGIGPRYRTGALSHARPPSRPATPDALRERLARDPRAAAPSAGASSASPPPRGRAALELDASSPIASARTLRQRRLSRVGEEQKVGYEEMLALVARGVRRRARFHRRRRGGVRAPRSRDARPRQPLRGAAGRRAGDRARGASRRRADRLRDRDPHRPLRLVRRRGRAPRRAPASSSARSPIRAGSCSARPARIRGARGRSSGSSTRRTTASTTSSSATSSGATTRSACTSTSGSTAPTARSASVRPSATTCRSCSRSPRARRSSRASSAASTRRARRSSRACSRAAASRTRSAAGTSGRRYVRFLYETGSISEHTQIWWSVRPHLTFPTVEIRICDAQPDLGESRSLAALCYSLDRARSRARSTRASRCRTCRTA